MNFMRMDSLLYCKYKKNNVDLRHCLNTYLINSRRTKAELVEEDTISSL